MRHDLDPPAALKLCEALKSSFRDENIWVYYDKAPLVPYLRSNELRRLGCVVPLPVDRLANAAAGQEVWTEAARLIAETTSAPEDKSAREKIANLLVRISSDDFAQVRRTPPLLYHTY